jgi:hypothetical protein
MEVPRFSIQIGCRIYSILVYRMYSILIHSIAIGACMDAYRRGASLILKLYSGSVKALFKVEPQQSLNRALIVRTLIDVVPPLYLVYILCY